MSRFGKTVSWGDYRLLTEAVDLSYYNTRKIHHVFPRCDKELDTIVINVAHHKNNAISSHPYTKIGDKTYLNRYKLRDALVALTSNGYLLLIKKHSHNPLGTGLVNVYQRTELFEKTFKFRLPERIRVYDWALSSSHIDNNLLEDKHMLSQPLLPHANRLKMKLQSGTAKKNWQELANKTELSLSNGHQIYKYIWLKHDRNGKLVQEKGCGNYGYQNMLKKERPFILIDGKNTVEIDYGSQFPSFLFNLAGLPCDSALYENILKGLGVRRCKKNRTSIKMIVLRSINVGSKSVLTRQVNAIKKGKSINILGVDPLIIVNLLNEWYPCLHVCSGHQSPILNKIGSGIMDDVLETIATKYGVVALPETDSIIIDKDYKVQATQIMKDCYKSRMGFEPTVKIKG